ncbi:general stress protein [Nodularia spumigena]|uniref:Signal transduction histidine kinase LytS n=1 Tax=Nodularia spumigena CENA596 TaxID=1819295 RepID=A0A161UTQ2_NODSP|nr:general stress protein [Nodularia spumigena]KZL49273.1 signal transduction histidine kinase LytS [Nodularia spumigena CENA596]MDB9316859.1 signal transduction histidine kinase LytS [Nodularia spumigena CS-590/01A]MDB9321530.1 signal transduction histidine kinase LytS [Nodularia spumigena CS-591/07A]MDB9327486.1 signal transduction histidine kinase LytS [Nodularia spumigena CS-590/02]MDB9329043.1 signal transduction histidine kinase LytS [Nodularia spumigena CS-591/04]
MVSRRYKRAIGTFPNRQQAEAALNELRDSGFPMDSVSILAKDTGGEQIAGTAVTDRGDTEGQEGAGIGATTGTVLGGLGGLLVGLEALVIPGVGPFLAGGTIATTLAGAGLGAAAGGIVGALTGLGIPEEEAKAYSERVSRGDYLVILDAPEDEINRAAALLMSQGIREWRVHDISGSPSSASDVAPTQSSTQRTTTEPGVDVVDQRDRIR